jgi:Flp pilus assembly protein TadD
LKASMQEVPVPVNIDRHGGIDYEAGHVNLYIDTNMSADLGTSITPKRGVIIDFEPTVGSARLGETQSPQSMLARFYNNLGAQSLVDGKYSRAYAHFRAAIQADPGFTGAFGNLAWLYQRMGYERDAEKVLLHATLLKTNSYVAIRGLHLLMVAQGRTQEAAKYEEILSAQRKQDPYYWIGVGLDQFKQENYHRAVDAFERAQSLTTGFSEVHRYLALAYLKEGQPTKVREQLIALESIDRNDPVLGPLNSKLKRLH